MTTDYLGQPINRVDGRAKVTGQAKYAGEYNVPNLAYGVVVSSSIAKGTIRQIDTNEALNLEGVLQVFTHGNSLRNVWPDANYRDEVAPPGAPFRTLHDVRILFSGQPVALVVANSFELARYAASLIRVKYDPEPHMTDLQGHRDHARNPAPRPEVDVQLPP